MQIGRDFFCIFVSSFILSVKKVIVSVINDLNTDRRVDKNCMALVKCGYEVLLVGRRKIDSQTMENREYKCHRMNLLFEKGAFFYAEYNIRLFFLLLYHKSDLLFANDLDTLLPNFIVSKIKRNKLIFDSHEYFTGVPELQDRALVRNIWKTIERFILPRLYKMITVNDSIAGLFKNEYRIESRVVRNIPLKKTYNILKTKTELGLPADKHIVLLQGAGINIDRGAEEAIDASVYFNNAILLIIGGGDVYKSLQKKVETQNLQKCVIMLPKQSSERLYEYTVHASIGLSIDKDSNINYHFSLPNKLFDYIQARVPVLVSNLPELRRIVVEYKIGDIIQSHDPKHIAEKINSMLEDTDRMNSYKHQLELAADILCWENEEVKLLSFIRSYD